MLSGTAIAHIKQEVGLGIEIRDKFVSFRLAYHIRLYRAHTNSLEATDQEKN